MPNPPEKPRFITNITLLQKTLAGVSGSMALMAAVTLIPWVQNTFFKDFLYRLSELRFYFAVSALVMGGWVGIPQLKYLIEWLFDFYEFYQKFGEFKKKGPNKEE